MLVRGALMANTHANFGVHEIEAGSVWLMDRLGKGDAPRGGYLTQMTAECFRGDEVSGPSRFEGRVRPHHPIAIRSSRIWSDHEGSAN